MTRMVGRQGSIWDDAGSDSSVSVAVILSGITFSAVVISPVASPLDIAPAATDSPPSTAMLLQLLWTVHPAGPRGINASRPDKSLPAAHTLLSPAGRSSSGSSRADPAAPVVWLPGVSNGTELGILLIEMKDRLYDVWARTHTLGGRGPKRLVTTCRVTYWEGTRQVWAVTKR